MRKALVLLAVLAGFVFAAPAFPFAIIHPETGECREVLLPGAAFPGNWDVVRNTPAAFPGPWNGHGHANENSALAETVRCPT